MGQKTHPIGFRIGVVRTWSSKWFENARYRQWLHEDILLRRFANRITRFGNAEELPQQLEVSVDHVHSRESEGTAIVCLLEPRDNVQLDLLILLPLCLGFFHRHVAH